MTAKKIKGIIINPKPPTSIRPKMISCPPIFQCSLVVNVVSPVTQVAEVAVNKASINGVPSPEFVNIGKVNNTLPNKMIPPKPKAIN